MAAPTGRPVSQSLSQAANARVNRVLAPQLQQQTSYGAHQNAVIRAFANSLLGKLQPIAGQVGQAYNTAIGQTAGLANQSAQYLQNANPNAQEQALLQAVNAPQAQQQQIATQLGNTFNGGAGALQYTQGTVPGSMLAAQGAAAQAQAAQLPGLAALKGQQDLASALWQQGQDRRTLEATRPQLYQQAAQDIRTNNAARARAAATAQQNVATNRDRAARLRQNATQFAQTRADKAATRAEKAAYDKAYFAHVQAGDSERVAHDKATEAASTARIAASQRNADVLAGISEQRVGISQQQANTSQQRANQAAQAKAGKAPTVHGNRQWDPVKKRWVKAPGLPAKTGAAAKTGDAATWPNLSRPQVKQLRAGMYASFKGVPKEKSKTGKALPPQDYQAAIDEGVSHGFSRAGVTKMANRFYMPGMRGRPLANGVMAGPGAGAPPGPSGPR